MIYSGNGPITSSNYYYRDVYFKQTVNINLSAHYWVPIGVHYDLSGNEIKRYFGGNYDGGNYTIFGLYINSAYDYQGLFGYVYGNNDKNFEIKNIKISSNCSIVGAGSLGAIAGWAYGYNIINCSNACTISGSNHYVGGIVGNLSDSGSISNCYNTGNISSNSYGVGGISGLSYSYIRNCYNTGKISSSSYQVGGICGYRGYVYDCINLGNVISTYSSTDTSSGVVGGIVGGDGTSWFFGTESSCIINCLNFGIISASNAYCVGGLIGIMQNNVFGTTTIYNSVNFGQVIGGSNQYTGGTIGYFKKGNQYNCYYLDSTCSQGVGTASSNTAGVTAVDDAATTGQNHDWYTDSANWDPSYLWNFDTVWDIQTCNNGFPVLRWNSEYIPVDTNGGTIFNYDERLVSNNFNVGNFEDPVLEGYTFEGWYDQKKGGKKITGDMVWGKDISGIEKIYAHWKLNSYTVVYDANGGTGSMENQAFDYNESKTLLENAFEYSGYRFVGWSLSQSGQIMAMSNLRMKKRFAICRWTVTMLSLCMPFGKELHIMSNTMQMAEAVLLLIKN